MSGATILYWLQRDLCIARSLLAEEKVDWSAVRATGFRALQFMISMDIANTYDEATVCAASLTLAYEEDGGKKTLLEEIDKVLKQILP